MNELQNTSFVLFAEQLNDSQIGVLVVFGIVCVIIVGVCIAWAQQQAIEKAKQAYAWSLGELKKDPHNPDLKGRTLELGRVYSNLTRNKQGVAIYDEMKLMNDINAATAAAGYSHEPEKKATSVADRLAKLNELKKNGLIDEQEYAEQRQKIISDV